MAGREGGHWWAFLVGNLGRVGQESVDRPVRDTAGSSVHAGQGRTSRPHMAARR
jgi:hypothetical protein